MSPLRSTAESLEPATPHVTLADIRAAAARIQGAVIRTPTIRCDALSRATGKAPATPTRPSGALA
jgi:threonine dehydratase